jgi:hypothetical protein
MAGSAFAAWLGAWGTPIRWEHTRAEVHDQAQRGE